MNRLLLQAAMLFVGTAGVAAPAAGAPLAVAAVQEDPVDGLVKAFRRAKADARNRIYSELKDLVYAEELGILLGERAAEAAKDLAKGRTLDSIEDIAEKRKALDEARAAALGLIFDQERYFTPYKVPQVSSERAAEYRRTQSEIDDLTEAVAEIWEDKKKVKLKSSFQAALEDYAWCAARLEELGKKAGAVGAASELPAWILGLGPEIELVTVQTFAWDAAERAQLDYNAAVLRTNAERGAAVAQLKKGVPELRQPTKGELDQVRATNDYRMMMGRRALAWNPLLQEAAQGHSDYQARWGTITHFEDKNPERYDPGKRCKLAGYDWPRSENCAMGTVGAKEVHERWRHSAGHHRNLLLADTTEMASAIAGVYWTQNFGVGPVTMETLEGWRDQPAGPPVSK